MYLYLLCIGFFVYFSIIYNESKNTTFFSPFILISTAYFVYFIFRSFVIFLNLDNLKEYFELRYITEDYIIFSLFIFIISFIFMYFGFKLFKITTNKKYSIGISFDLINTNKLFIINYIMFFIWISVTLYKSFNGMTHYAGEYDVAERTSFGLPYIMSIINTLFSFSFYFLIYLYMKYGIYKKFFYLALFIRIVIAMISGGALGLISIFLAFIVLFFWATFFDIKNKKIRRINVSKLVLYGVIGFIVLLVTYVVKEFSRLSIGLNISIVDLVVNVDILFDFLSKLDFSKILFNLFNRFHGIDSLSIIIKAVDDNVVSYSYGNMFYLLITGILPRFIIHDKPEIAMGQWFTETLWNRDLGLTGYQSTALFIPGDLYLNFGIPGIIIGMFIYGVLLKLLYRFFFNNKYTIFSFVFVSNVFFYFIVYEYTLASWLLILLRTFLLLIVYSLLIKTLLLIKITKKKESLK